jgi:2-oxoglutarate ferredoxin oxidoreductase subunit alpha
MDEALESLAGDGIHLDALRLRAYPFPARVAEFVTAHDHVFVVEQNRDAQMRTLLINELDLDPARLIPVLHYDGTPVTGRFVVDAITRQVHQLAVQPRRGRKVA